MRTRDVVVVDDFLGSPRPLRRAAPELRVGPMLLAPLVAHDTMLGVLAVARDIGAPHVHPRDSHRLRVIADHAALAFWKAELLEQAQAADRAKSRFLATVSHELRTPLTALAGYEELLADQVIGPLSENQLDVLERMRAVTQHLDRRDRGGADVLESRGGTRDRARHRLPGRRPDARHRGGHRTTRAPEASRVPLRPFRSTPFA